MIVRFLLLIFFLCVSTSAHAALPDEMLKDSVLETRAHEIGEQLRCLVCQNESIEDSAAPLAHDLRVLLRNRIKTGDSDTAAREYIVARYGDYVLLKPPFKKVTMALWLGPFVLLLVALGFVAAFYRRAPSAERVASSPHKFAPLSEGDAFETQRMLLIISPVILLAAGLLYLHLGTPELADRPFAERQNDPDFQLNASAETISRTLAAHPDAEGYKRLAGMFYALHRFDRATEAAQKATALNAKDAEAWSLLGESMVMQNDGAVVMDAMNAFKIALKYSSTNFRSRFYIGLAEAEIGDFKKAVSIWRDLEKTAPPHAPWLAMVKKNIALYAQMGAFDPASITPAPPALK